MKRDAAAAGTPDGTAPGIRADGRATAEQVVAAAERLFAERGVEAVSLREVGKAAASRNTAVAHYHFGGKEGLIRAIVARRAPLARELPGLDRRRFRHRRDLLVQLVVGALAARASAEASDLPDLGTRADFTGDLLEAAVGLMLAPAGPGGRDPRLPG